MGETKMAGIHSPVKNPIIKRTLISPRRGGNPGRSGRKINRGTSPHRNVYFLILCHIDQACALRSWFRRLFLRGVLHTQPGEKVNIVTSNSVASILHMGVNPRDVRYIYVPLATSDRDDNLITISCLWNCKHLLESVRSNPSDALFHIPEPPPVTSVRAPREESSPA